MSTLNGDQQVTRLPEMDALLNFVANEIGRMRWAASSASGMWHRLSQNLEPTRKPFNVRSRCGLEFHPMEMDGRKPNVPEHTICKRCVVLDNHDRR